MHPFEYCQRVCQKSASSFIFSFNFLPLDKKNAMQVLYAYCRELDDIVDNYQEKNIAALKLAWWQTEIVAISNNSASHPIARALQLISSASTTVNSPLNTKFNLPIELLSEIIAGMEMDLDENRYADFKSLCLYCYRVAGVVGILSAEIFGNQNKNTQKYAQQLGLALQLTNILRDIREDAERGRIYLPLDELQQFSLSEKDVLLGINNDNFSQLIDFQFNRAQDCYRQAYTQLASSEIKAQMPGLIMANLYYHLLLKIYRNKSSLFKNRIKLTKLEKLYVILKTLVILNFKPKLLFKN